MGPFHYFFESLSYSIFEDNHLKFSTNLMFITIEICAFSILMIYVKFFYFSMATGLVVYIMFVNKSLFIKPLTFELQINLNLSDALS